MTWDPDPRLEGSFAEVRGPLPPRPPDVTAGVVPFHLPGRHNQKDHGHGGHKGPKGAPGGAGAAEGKGAFGGAVSDTDAQLFQGGSAAEHLTVNDKGETVFTPERQALHEQIMNDTLAGFEPQANPRYHMMGGGPASGKSSMEKMLPEVAKGHALLNSDNVKLKLPEFKARSKTGAPGLAGRGAKRRSAAAFTHEESSWVTKRIQDEAFRRKLNVTLDGTGDNGAGGVTKKVTAARNAGYSVHAYYVTTPTDAAVARAIPRGARTGRVVPEPVIRATHRDVSGTFPKVLNEFDSAVLVDNTTRTPALILERKGGRTTVHDQALYDAFLAKANE